MDLMYTPGKMVECIMKQNTEMIRITHDDDLLHGYYVLIVTDCTNLSFNASKINFLDTTDFLLVCVTFNEQFCLGEGFCLSG